MADKKQKGVSPFIFKLYQLVQESQDNKPVCWGAEANTFMIKDVTQFCREVLPKYFKHNNFSSFIRQLNIYGFTKTKIDSTQHTYFNPNFSKDCKQKLKLIKRKSTPVKEGQQSLIQDSIEYMGGMSQKQKKNLLEYNKQNEKIQQYLKQQFEHHQNLQNQNQIILNNCTDVLIFLLSQMNLRQQNIQDTRKLLKDSLSQNKSYRDIISDIEIKFNLQINLKYKNRNNISKYNQQSTQKIEQIELQEVDPYELIQGEQKNISEDECSLRMRKYSEKDYGMFESPKNQFMDQDNDGFDI